MKKLTRIVFPVAIIALNALNSTTSYANNTKHYPGIECIPHRNSNIYLSNGVIFNKSKTERLFVTCPITKNIRMNGYVHHGYVDVFDAHYTENVHCSLSSQFTNNNGEWRYWTDTKRSDGSSTKRKRLQYGKVWSNADSHYTYYCTIPPMYNNRVSGISSYYIDERR